MMKKINVLDETTKIKDYWSPVIASELNGQHIKLAKVKGDFVWHSHEHGDEMFLVQKGTLFIEFKDKTIELNEGEMLVIPKTVEHRPYTVNDSEAWIMLFEPANTVNTGNVKSELTKLDLKKL